MTVFRLPKENIFPHPDYAEKDGLLAIGGDLKPERLINAYANGIFPWYSRKPIAWYSPDPRCVMVPEKFHVSKTMQQLIRRKTFEIRTDSDFRSVITNCAKVKRSHEKGTWITKYMIEAYCELHTMGIAHSFEAYCEEKLVGGLYGLSLGRMFFGESMFHLVPNASKIAFHALVEFCKAHNFDLIDNQVTTPHLLSLGATEISRTEYLAILTGSLKKKTISGNWNIKTVII